MGRAEEEDAGDASGEGGESWVAVGEDVGCLYDEAAHAMSDEDEARRRLSLELEYLQYP